MTFPAMPLLVPHSDAMVLLDRVIAADQDSLSAEVCIGAHSLFCQAEGVGAWVGIEYMAQAIAAYAGYQAHLQQGAPKIGFLLGTRRYSCNVPFFTIGTVLQIQVHHTLTMANGLRSFDCTIHMQKHLLASATITVVQPDDMAMTHNIHE